MPGKLLPTIKSRCHGVPFYPLHAKDMGTVMQSWDPELTSDTYEMVSHVSQGSLGLAQQFLNIENDLISKVTHLFTQALQGTQPAPSTLDSIVKDKHYELGTYLITYWCQQVTYLQHQQPYYLPVGLFPQNLIQIIQDFSPTRWLETTRDVDQLIQQQGTLKLDAKNTLLTLLYKLGKTTA
jgi:hypothetical protein